MRMTARAGTFYVAAIADRAIVLRPLGIQFQSDQIAAEDSSRLTGGRELRIDPVELRPVDQQGRPLARGVAPPHGDHAKRPLGHQAREHAVRLLHDLDFPTTARQERWQIVDGHSGRAIGQCRRKEFRLRLVPWAAANHRQLARQRRAGDMRQLRWGDVDQMGRRLGRWIGPVYNGSASETENRCKYRRHRMWQNECSHTSPFPLSTFVPTPFNRHVGPPSIDRVNNTYPRMNTELCGANGPLAGKLRREQREGNSTPVNKRIASHGQAGFVNLSSQKALESTGWPSAESIRRSQTDNAEG